MQGVGPLHVHVQGVGPLHVHVQGGGAITCTCTGGSLQVHVQWGGAITCTCTGGGPSNYFIVSNFHGGKNFVMATHTNLTHEVSVVL